MLRRASVLLGLAVLLSLLFPVKALLKESGVDPLALQLPVVDLAVVCVLLGALPAFFMFRDAQLAHRIPRWSGWVVLLAVCSTLFLLLHVSWSHDLAASYVREALAGGGFGFAISDRAFLRGLELAARLGVLVSLVAVLVRLETVPEEGIVVPRRRK
jgi:hypothetical protein